MKNVLSIHVENNEDFDEEMRGTLNSLLQQIIEDDGSLTFEDLSHIHETVKSLLDVGGEENVEVEEEDEEEERKRRKRKKMHRNGKGTANLDSSGGLEDSRSKKEALRYDDDLKPSKKKRRYETERRSKKDDGLEIESGEIDDVYDNEFIVQKEFQDLLVNKKRSNTRNY